MVVGADALRTAGPDESSRAERACCGGWLSVGWLGVSAANVIP